MYVALSGPKGKESVTVREDYLPLGSTKKKIRIIKNYGPKRLLLENNPNFIEELKEQVRKETNEKKSEKNLLIPASCDEIMNREDGYQFLRIGHAIVMRLWAMMGLDEFFKKNCTKKNADKIISGLEYLVCRRLSEPSSIRASFFAQASYAGMSEITMEVLYTILDELNDKQDALIEYLGSYFEKNTDRNLDHVCYDVTNYYFESTVAGELRLFGFSKEHKNNEVIVVMGLLIDDNGIPITFKLFPGNTMDQNTLISAVEDLKAKFGLQDITIVADRGMNSNENLIFISDEGHHFVISYTLKKASQEFKAKCIGTDTPWEVMQYDNENGELVYASKVIDTKCKAKKLLTAEELDMLQNIRAEKKIRGRYPKYKTVEIDAKVHVTYSRSRAEKDRLDRQRALDKLKKRIANGQVAASMRYGCNQFVDIAIDESTCSINETKVKEAEQYDGFYAVVTDKVELTTEEVMNIYKDQWKIEESFRIMKTDLEARPVFVWKDERVSGHFTLCYLCLSMIRYIQYIVQQKTGEQISAQRIMNSIYEPIAIILGNQDSPYLGASVTDDYILISSALGMPMLQKTMSVTRFKALTKLDPKGNLKRLVGEN